jgi:hypothetical protein
MTTKTVFRFLIFTGISFLFSCSDSEFTSNRLTYNLSGSWQFALDSTETGINEKWFEKELAEEVKLPGTLDEIRKFST